MEQNDFLFSSQLYIRLLYIANENMSNKVHLAVTVKLVVAIDGCRTTGLLAVVFTDMLSIKSRLSLNLQLPLYGEGLAILCILQVFWMILNGLI